MRKYLSLVLMSVVLGFSARAEEPADSIEAVIVSQLQAFQSNDLAGAFSHASPTVQSKFGTPQVFGQMVKGGYPMVWRPSRYRMQALVETGAGLFQLVLFEDRRGELFEARYEMQQIDGVWRINGVFLRKQPGASS